MFHNLACTGFSMMSTLSNALLQKVLKLVPLKATGSELYVFTMTIVISYSYDDLEETLNHMNSLKLNNHICGNFPY